MIKNILLVHDVVEDHASLDELDTLVQVNQVEEVLQQTGYSCKRYPFSGNLNNLEDYLKHNRVDVVCNLVETYYGARMLHTIPLICESLRIRVTGGGASSLFLTSDKVLAKRMMVLAGIPTPRWVDPQKRETWSSFLKIPLIKKPRTEDASIGIDDNSVFSCETIEELIVRIVDAEEHHQMLEEFVQGREINISIAMLKKKLEIFPIAEMIFIDFPPHKPQIVGYEAKWCEDSFAYHHTQRSFAVEKETALVNKLRDLAQACWNLFDCSGYARVDVRIDETGNPFVLELNINPCIAKDSGFIAACNQAGYTYAETIVGIIEGAQCVYTDIS